MVVFGDDSPLHRNRISVSNIHGLCVDSKGELEMVSALKTLLEGVFDFFWFRFYCWYMKDYL